MKNESGMFRGSLAVNSAWGAASDMIVTAGALAIGVMTARWLGPAGKGTYSTLLLIGHGFLFYALSLGLSDASIFMMRNLRQPMHRAVAASLPPLLLSSAAGFALLFAIIPVADWSAILPSVGATALGLAAWIYLDFLIGVLNSEERFRMTSGTRAAVSLMTAAFTFLLIGVWDGELFGAVLAVLLAVGGGALFLARVLISRGISLRPRWDPTYLRPALRFGIPTQMSYVLLLMAQRSDQLIVYAVEGEAEGGFYSVSLTLGWLVTYAPAALTKAAFPRIAALEAEEATALLAQILRISIFGSLTMASALALSIPFVVPAVFGASYRPSIKPALLLLGAGVIWSAQWALTRAAGARGRPLVLLGALAANFATTVSLDLILIPVWGLEGAAFASLAGSFVGLVTCLLLGVGDGLSLAQAIPRYQDVATIMGSLKQGFRSGV